MTTPTREPITIEPPAGPANASIIWLHGLGADGTDFEPVARNLPLSAGIHARIILPHAPLRPITVNGGMVMPGWYDITGFDRYAIQDESGIKTSADYLNSLIDAEKHNGIDTQRIVLIGFSQGAALSLYTGLRAHHPLGGIGALSGYTLMPDTLKDERSTSNATTPIFIGHGDHDDVVNPAYGNEAADQLTTLGYAVEHHRYPMPHCICDEEIQALTHWLNQILSA